MKKIKLKDKYIHEWDYKLRKELYDIIVDKLEHEYNIKQTNIEKILVAGSRSYKIKKYKKPIFKMDSDLDIMVIIHTEKYIELSNKHNSKYPVNNPMDGLTLKPFKFNDINISIFIFPSDYNIIKFYKWNLPKYDLLTLKQFGKYTIDVLDYIINNKNRIDPFEFCMICESESKNTYLVYYSIVDKNGSLDDHHCFSICENCFQKIDKIKYSKMNKYRFVKMIKKLIKLLDKNKKSAKNKTKKLNKEVWFDGKQKEK